MEKALTTDSNKILDKFREITLELAPNANEAISYGIPTFKVNGKNLVHFAAYKNHIGFYPTPEIIELFKNDIKDYKYAKGSVQFPLDKPIPYNLVKKMIKTRVNLFQNQN